MDTSWKEAIQIFSATEEFKNDPDMQKIDPVDLLLEFEDYIKSLEAILQKSKAEELAVERRAERLARQEMRVTLYSSSI